MLASTHRDVRASIADGGTVELHLLRDVGVAVPVLDHDESEWARQGSSLDEATHRSCVLAIVGSEATLERLLQQLEAGDDGDRAGAAVTVAGTVEEK
jgi:hypothetical protein